MASTGNTNSIIQSRSNTSTSPKRNYYDVFVSFRGKDTRYNFTDHLFAALQRKGIFAFRDDTKLNKGESIEPELFQAIKDSQIFIVVFSKNYASSTWCLRELEHILLHCGQPLEKHVLPVFYDVDPSEVRHQKGTYSEALAKHEERFQHDSHMVRRWRAALAQVADFSGWDVRHKPQHAEIEKIVEEIIRILDSKFSSLQKDSVGMHSRMGELEKHLLLDSFDDVRVVGICGMGGIGKTTLATALYNKISHQFHVCCLIDDLSKSYRQDGPITAQKQILLQTVGDEQLQTFNSYNTSNLIRSRLHRVKALIMIDNIDKVEQLEKLAVSREWLGAGSRIILISRDEHILKEYGVDAVYHVPLMDHTNSLQLLCLKAFKLDHILSGYDKLASEILHYANGLPLAIKILGSFLFSRNISEWESALARLGESPNKDIMDVLRLSVDGLEKMEKEIFLHIACFFYFESVEYVKNVLNCCGFFADIGLGVLIDNSLISLLPDMIEMHGLLRELGQNIVQEKSSKESRKWSRVWLPEQIHDVMLENMEKKVEAMSLTGCTMEIETLQRMSHLILLIIKKVVCSGELTRLSNKLRYVEWDDYPYMCLPSNFQPNHLVELVLRRSSVKQLWKDKKYLPNLKTLDLSRSKNVIMLPDFSEIPNIEWLNLEGCVKLVQIDPSLGVLRKLVFLNLKNCKNLANIPNNIFGLSTLECLCLSGCPKVLKNPRYLNINKNTSYSMYPDALRDLASCLLPSLLGFSSLLKLDISFSGLNQLPDAIKYFHWLEELNLTGNNFVTLPSLRELSKLVYLNLEHCKMLKSLPRIPFPSSIRHCLAKDKYGRRIGLVIFNCPKLGESEHCNSVALSWMIQLIKTNQEFSSIYHKLDFVVPGSEIPSWCNNQIKGNSIRIDASPIMHEHDNDNNLIGIACFAVFSVDPITTTNAQIPHSIRIILTKPYPLCSRLVPVTLESDLIEVKSYHLCLVYLPLESFYVNFVNETESEGELDEIDMIVHFERGNDLGLVVQKCGYYWVYKQDLQQMHGS